MSLPDAITVRGEMLSLFVAALLLFVAVRPVARLTGLDARRVGDLFWNAGLAFIVAGRLAYLAMESRASLTDPLVLIRIQGGIEPLAGAAAVAVVWWWHARRDAASRALWAAAAAAGLVLATIAYDGACVIRDACYGAPAPAPLGFRMSGLADTRVATPLVEAAVLLLLVAVVLRMWPRLTTAAAAAWLVAGVALLRVALTPLSAIDRDAIDAETAMTLTVGLAALVAAAWWSRRAPAAAASPP